MLELVIRVIYRESNSIELNNGVEFIINTDYVNILDYWREGDAVSVQKLNNHDDKLSYKITNGSAFVLAQRNN